MLKVSTAGKRSPMCFWIAMVLLAAAVSEASGQTSTGAVTNRAQGTAFITPVPSRLVIYPEDPDYPRGMCPRRPGVRCTPVLRYGGGQNALPTIDPPLKADVPNVRVSFVLEEITQDSLSGGIPQGIGKLVMRWETTSPAATLELTSSQLDVTDLESGVPWILPEPQIIYDALILGACDSFSSFPIDHYAHLEFDGDPEEGFHGTDHSTIDSTGFYTFKYSFWADVVRFGDVFATTFQLSGKLAVTCTSLTSLD
jgi:hypothetical protein